MIAVSDVLDDVCHGKLSHKMFEKDNGLRLP
jgi:hypothetical protein